MTVPIEAILNDGVKAPSGENCQPWRFVYDYKKLSVFNVPEADLSLYNTKQRGSCLAHGALLENITISAKKNGYTAEIIFFPNQSDETHVADIFFETCEVQILPLYDAIRARCTNRKDYRKEKLSDDEKTKLIESLGDSEHNKLIIVDDELSMKSIGKALASHEKVLFENKKMHDFFFNHILWKKEDEKKSNGFFIDTLEFLPRQLPLVKLLKNWRFVTILNAILKVSNMISHDNGEKYAYGGAMGAITMKGGTSLDYVRTGMSMQRIWLTATKLGVAMHPCNGTLYLMAHMEECGSHEFSKEHSNIIHHASKGIVETFRNPDDPIAFIFRMGKAENPTAVASRTPPVVEYTTS